MTNQRKSLILEGPLRKAIFTLALPIIASNLIQTVYNLTDTYFVSGLGDDPLAAMQITYPLIFLMISLGMGLSVGGIALISQYIGSDERESARRISGQILVLALIASLITGLIGFMATPHILTLMGAEGSVHQYATLFLSTMFLGAPTLFIQFAFNGIRQGQGDMMTPMVINVLSVITNIVLDPIFIYSWGFGIVGAAYATILSRFIFDVVAIILLFRKSRHTMTLTLSDLKLKLAYVKRIISVGMPAALSQGMTSIGFTVMNSFVLAFGTEIVISFAIGNRISSIIFMPAMGIGGALSTIVGQNIGAGQIERADQAFRKSALYASSVMVIGAMIMAPFSETLIAIFSDNARVIAEGGYYLRMILVSIPIFGVFNCLIGLFQGSGHTFMALSLNVGRLWFLRIPMLMLLGYLGIGDAKFIWYAMVISNFIIVIYGIWLYKWGRWRRAVI